MQDRLFLECIRGALVEYQRQAQKPSAAVGRLIDDCERELEGLRSIPFEAEPVIEVLIMFGFLSPKQREWAKAYYQRDPSLFREYIRRSQLKPCPS